MLLNPASPSKCDESADEKLRSWDAPVATPPSPPTLKCSPSPAFKPAVAAEAPPPAVVAADERGSIGRGRTQFNGGGANRSNERGAGGRENDDDGDEKDSVGAGRSALRPCQLASSDSIACSDVAASERARKGGGTCDPPAAPPEAKRDAAGAAAEEEKDEEEEDADDRSDVAAALWRASIMLVGPPALIARGAVRSTHWSG